MESNLQQWLSSAEETINDRRVSAYLEELDEAMREQLKEEGRDICDRSHKTTLQQIARILLPMIDKNLKNYAEDWNEVSRHHKEAGLYRDAVEFFKPEEGLLVDIGCGGGRLIEELPFDSVIGVDINNYCLQFAEEALKTQGRAAERRSRTYISFHPKRGFVLRPYPVMEELDFNRIQLLADDIEDLRNTVRVLYNQGRKADSMSFMLPGGYSAQQVEFLELLRDGKPRAYVTHPYKWVGELVTKICKPNGSVYLGLRQPVIDADTNTLVSADVAAEYVQKEIGNTIGIERAKYLDLIQENGITGIKLFTKVIDYGDEGKEKLRDPTAEENGKISGICKNLLLIYGKVK